HVTGVQTCALPIYACPTDAIVADRVVDGSKCISYFTIELKNEIPVSEKGKFHDWMFGCDICQDVCPWNKFSKGHKEPLFNPHPDLLSMDKKTGKKLLKKSFKRSSEKARSNEQSITDYSAISVF